MPEELRTDPRLQMPIYITAAHFYLDDMTEALRPTKLIPGSHLSGRRPNVQIPTFAYRHQLATRPRAGEVRQIGREDGRECVKLEDMVVLTNGKCQLLSTFPFEEDLLI